MQLRHKYQKVPWYYRPGRSVLMWCEANQFPPPNHPLLRVLVLPLLAVVGVWIFAHPGLWNGMLASLLITVEALLAYFDRVESAAAKSVRDQVWDDVARLNESVTGHIAMVMEAFESRHREADNKRKAYEEYKQDLHYLQQHLLRHITDLVAVNLGQDPLQGKLSANWAVRGEGVNADEFRVLIYDRNMPNRRPQADDWKPIADGLPGASTAFKEKVVALVSDTHAPDVRHHFSEIAAYRSILSLPIVCREEVIGVVNIDATEPDVLLIDHDKLVMDVAYLIGMCHLLREE